MWAAPYQYIEHHITSFLLNQIIVFSEVTTCSLVDAYQR
jgi:hypothetical protein